MLAVLSSLDRGGCRPLRPRAVFSLLSLFLFIQSFTSATQTSVSECRNLAEIGGTGAQRDGHLDFHRTGPELWRRNVSLVWLHSAHGACSSFSNAAVRRSNAASVTPWGCVTVTQPQWVTVWRIRVRKPPPPLDWPIPNKPYGSVDIKHHEKDPLHSQDLQPGSNCGVARAAPHTPRGSNTHIRPSTGHLTNTEQLSNTNKAGWQRPILVQAHEERLFNMTVNTTYEPLFGASPLFKRQNNSWTTVKRR